MRIVIVLTFFAFGICYHRTSAKPTLKYSHGVPILWFKGNSFDLDVDKMNKILKADGIKDRHVVVVSIVGTRGEGKSFLMNFFIRYLQAQVI